MVALVGHEDPTNQQLIIPFFNTMHGMMIYVVMECSGPSGESNASIFDFMTTLHHILSPKQIFDAIYSNTWTTPLLMMIFHHIYTQGG
jgi:hypothetical protein